MARQQRRSSSYSQIPIAAPRVPANMAWIVLGTTGVTIDIQIVSGWERAFLVGFPNFTFSQVGLSVVSAALVGDSLIVQCNTTVIQPVVITLGVNDPALRNYFGGFLSSQQVDVITVVVPPAPFAYAFASVTGNVLQLLNATDGRQVLGALTAGLLLNGTPGLFLAAWGVGSVMNIEQMASFISGDIISWGASDAWTVAFDGGQVLAGSITIP